MNDSNMKAADMEKTHIVKFIRRRDGKTYYYRHDGNLTARRESSMRLEEPVAKQLALAIRKGHKDFTAVALPYKLKPRKRHMERAKAPKDTISIKLVEVKNDQP